MLEMLSQSIDLTSILSTIISSLIIALLSIVSLYMKGRKDKEDINYAIAFVRELVKNLVLKYEQIKVIPAKEKGKFTPTEGAIIKEDLLSEAASMLPINIKKILEKSGIDVGKLVGNICESVICQLRGRLSASSI